MAVLVLARLGLGYGMGTWYGIDQEMDDLAMFKGLSLQRITNPDEKSLIKNLGYSVFLGITAISGIPYSIMTGILWSVTALVVWLFLRKTTDKKWVQLLGFIYVLFLPIAFESWGGLRAYRNSIIAPCIILTFALFLLFFVDIIKGKTVKKATILTSVFAGIAFCFTYFLKEDGIWLKLSVAALLAVCICVIIFRFITTKKKSSAIIKKSAIWIVICIVPFVVFFLGDKLYRSFNQMAFGVYEINTRTEGELGKFVYNVYKIDSPNRNLEVWAPHDAIEAAFEASPTLKQYPTLLEGILTTEWFDGDIIANPIRKDFLTWVIRTELIQAGLWTSESDVNNMFKTINSELEQAFKDGTLKKADGRIQIISSIAGYTPEEIKNSNLASQMWHSFEDAVWLKGYTIGYDYNLQSNNPKIEKTLNMSRDDLNTPTGKKREISKGVAEVICVFYRIVNTALIVMSVGVIIVQVVNIFKNLKHFKKYFSQNKLKIYLAGISLFFFGITIAYAFATAWFFLQPAGLEHYGRQVFVFYNVGVPALLLLAYISAAPCIANLQFKRNHKK